MEELVGLFQMPVDTPGKQGKQLGFELKGKSQASHEDSEMTDKPREVIESAQEKQSE